MKECITILISLDLPSNTLLCSLSITEAKLRQEIEQIKEAGIQLFTF